MKSIFTSLFIAFFLCSFAQRVPILERKITISLTDEKLSIALTRIAQEGKFSFSYNTSIINDEQTVSVAVVNKSIRDVLNQLFKGTMDYKEKSSHLILTKPPIKKAEATTTVVIISGYVEDAETKEKVADASVYDKKSITSAVTDQYGYFKMKLDKKDQQASITVSKKDYRDTLVSITAPSNQYLNISITPIQKDSVIVRAETISVDSIKEEKKEEQEFTLPYEDDPNIQNISDTLYRFVQVSLFPFIGTNGRLSGNVVNDYSINIFGGYSAGTRKIELGAFFNLDRGDVRWLQIAGFGNLVRGDVFGIQAAGFFNVNGGSVVAAQSSGYVNLNFGDFSGVQTTGFTNVNLKSVHGVSIAGFANITGEESRGVQVAGFANIQRGNYKGSQIAGGANIITDHIDGSQISALFNHGKKVRGTQIGLVNYADSLGGVPIGLVSFVKKGYHKIEVSADEVFYANAAFRTGVRQFYNILMVGMQPEANSSNNGENVWAFGYGLGTAPKLNRWLDLNIDATSQHVNKGSFTSELSCLNKLSVGLDFHVAKRFSIATALTLNGYFTKTTFTDYPDLFIDYKPHFIYDHTSDNNTNVKMWWGGKIGLRFL